MKAAHVVLATTVREVVVPLVVIPVFFFCTMALAFLIGAIVDRKWEQLPRRIAFAVIMAAISWLALSLLKSLLPN
jgi:hypothetical protein